MARTVAETPEPYSAKKPTEPARVTVAVQGGPLGTHVLLRHVPIQHAQGVE